MALPTHKGIMLANGVLYLGTRGTSLNFIAREGGGGASEHSGFVLIKFIKSPHKALLVSLRESAYRKQGT